MFRRFLTRGVPIFLFLGLLSAGAWASDPIECFTFQIANSPAKVPGRAVPVSSQDWCYLQQEVDGKRYQFIFKNQAGSIRLENSGLVELSDGGLPQEITHGSLLHGQVTVHRSQMVNVNPLPVPLTIERAEKLASRSSHFVDETNWVAAQKMVHTFFERRSRHAFRWKVQPGVFEAHADVEHQPYAGFWWPYRGIALAHGPFSPLGKYDSFVQNTTGTNPMSMEWEARNHNLEQVEWGGHCNGWAASSTLYPDYSKPLWDAKSKKLIYSSDIKGMLAEASFCVDFAFYGYRYYGNPGDDLKDIYPHKLQEVLAYYIGNLKKPVNMDYVTGESVDNHVISGYKLTVTAIGADPKKYYVVADLSVHNYQVQRDETSGKAPIYHRIYKYTLETDAAGEVTNGTWLGSDNPDFLWVALAQANCAGEDPNINPDLVVKLATSLPEAKATTTPVDFALSRSMTGGEKVDVPLPELGGGLFKVKINVENSGGPSLYLEAVGTPAYPIKDASPSAVQYFQLPASGPKSVSILANRLESLKVVNYDQHPTDGTKLTIESIESLSAR